MARHAHGFQHGLHRHAIALGTDRDDQQLRHGKADRQAKGGCRSLSELAFERHRATKPCGIGAHHIQADAAPRKVADRGGGRKSSGKQQVKNIPVVQRRRALRADQALAAGGGADAIGIDAAAIVGQADEDIIAFGPYPQTDGGQGGLARRKALGGTFDTMVHRIANQVQQRLEQFVDDRLVGFHRAAVDHQLRWLAQPA